MGALKHKAKSKPTNRQHKTSPRTRRSSFQDGGERAIYIKAHNICGDICFIDITKSGGLSVQLSNRTRVKAVQGSTISTAVITSTQECAGNGVCG